MSVYKGSTLIAGRATGGGGTSYTILTDAQYQALVNKDASMLYVVKIDNGTKITLYLGELPLDTGGGSPYMVPNVGLGTMGSVPEQE